MTTLPTYLPGLMRDAVAAGLDVEARFHPFTLGAGAALVITWPEGEETHLGWELLRGRWVPDEDNIPLRDVRARIRREAQR